MSSSDGLLYWNTCSAMELDMCNGIIRLSTYTLNKKLVKDSVTDLLKFKVILGINRAWPKSR